MIARQGALIAVAAVLGGVASLGVGACGEDRGEVQVETAGTATTRTGTVGIRTDTVATGAATGPATVETTPTSGTTP